MKVWTLALSLFIAFALLAATPTPTPLSQNVAATHAGIVACAALENPNSDGVIHPNEYGESYFDGTTKILVYFTCDNSTERLLHVGIVAPEGGWVGLMIQARDVWDGTMNEVRLSRIPSSGGVQAEDGLRNTTLASFRSDSSLGGSDDVLNAATGVAGAATVYEFAVPLLSPDPADSQLRSNGPFYFAVEANLLNSDLESDPVMVSEMQTLVLQSSPSLGIWTSVELSVAASAPRTESRLLLSLRNEQGYPLPGMSLEVFVRTTFDFLDLGSVVTNDQGVAEVTYVSLGAGTFVVGAAYAGGGGFLASAAWRFLEVAETVGGGDLGSGFLGQGGVLELRPIEAIIVVVVGGVWATYAYAVFVTWQALRSERRREAGSRGPRPLGRWGR